jgi:exodeoxyribonuclease VII small subunit
MNGDDIESLTYETAILELDGIIERLERGAVALDEAIAAYERGTRLARHCGALLDRTEQKLSQLVVSGSGQSEKVFLPEGEAAEPELPAVGAVPPPPAAPASPPAAPGGTAAPAVSLTAPRRDRLPIDPDDIPF